MSDDIPLPPVPASNAAASSSQKSAPVAAAEAVAAARMLALRDIPVQSAPAAMKDPEKHARTQGRVVHTDARTGTVRISTPEGEIVLQPRMPLPQDAEVMVDIHMRKGAALANVTVLRRHGAAESPSPVPSPAALPPPPPLREGAVVTALLLPERESPPPESAPPPLSPGKISALVMQMKIAGLHTLPFAPPVPPETAAQILDAPDPAAAFRALPAPTQEKITAFFSRPAVLSFVRNALPAPQWAALDIPQEYTQAPAAPENAPPPRDVIRQVLVAYLQHPVFPMAAPFSAPQTPEDAPQPFLPPGPRVRQEVPTPPAQETPGTETPAPAAAPRTQVPGILQALLPLIAQSASQTQNASTPQRQAHIPPEETLPLPRNMFSLKIVRILPPAAPPEAVAEAQRAAPAPSVPVFRAGVVETVTPDGIVVIKSEGSHFVLQAPAAVPEGSRIVFEPTALSPQQVLTGLASAAPGPERPAPAAETPWPALHETLKEALLAVSAAAPAAAQALKNALPAPAPRFTPAALFFLAALRMGDVGAWLGESILAPLRQSGRKDLADRLAGDFSRTAEQARDVQPGGWKTLNMPLLHDSELSQLRFHIRHQDGQDKGRDEKESGPRATRFILDLRLSRMGDMQLDGYIHKKKFDMILRTQDPLPFAMRQEIMKKFAAGIGQAHMQGGIGFQVKKESWVTVDDAPPRAGTLA